MMLLAQPGQTDYLQYGWVFQYAAGIGFFLNSMQFFGLYPDYGGTLTGLCNSFLALCSLVPQLWLNLIIKWEVLSYSTILSIWLVAAVLSLVIGLIIVPWNNMPQNLDGAKDDDFATFIQIKKAKKRIFTRNEETFFEQVKQSAALLKSPIFIVHVVMFASGNCTTTLSLNFVNRIMCDTVGDSKFRSLQSQFEFIRASGDFILCPTIGFLADKSMIYWNKRRQGLHS